ncbi:restriction endonuclease subunit S [Paenibacillus sp. CR_12]|uniref:restriction endonuclease subunit S n=1 Tax=Paenibacillus sp. CR_12 TaxID=3055793 RepID=UPI0035BF95D5
MAGKDKKPDIRFTGFTDDWEQRKLGEIYTERNERGDDSLQILSVSIHHGISNEELDSNTLGKKVRRSEDKTLYKHVYFGDLVLNMMRAWQGAIGVVKSEGMVSPAYITAIPSAQLYPLFMDYSLRRDETIIQMNNLSYGVTDFRKRLYWDSFINVLCRIPSVPEQERITAFFAHIDNLITLNQRKSDKLIIVKKTMLEKMFPKDGANVPEIRFSGFTGDWEQREWVNTVDISTNMVDPKTGKYDNLPHIGPGNIESFSGRLYDNVKTVKEDNLISGKFHFNKGDVIYGKINPQLGKYVFAPFEGLASADAYVLNAKNGLDQTFLFTLLQTRQFFKYSVSVSMRSGMPKINRDELNEYEFIAPSVQEQKRIGEFFLLLHQLITLHQRKLEKLKNIKKAMLEKMFV